MRQSQNPWELAKMLGFIKENRVQSILEIGSRYGETLVEMAGAMEVPGKIVSIELPGGPWGRPDSLPILQGHIEELREAGHDVTLILGNSQDDDVIKQAAKLGPYDFIFIDGDHSIEGVTSDWEIYGPMGRYIAFHDIDTHLDVAPFWKTVKLETSTHWEFIAPDGPKMGIGICA